MDIDRAVVKQGWGHRRYGIGGKESEGGTEGMWKLPITWTLRNIEHDYKFIPQGFTPLTFQLISWPGALENEAIHGCII